MNKIFFFIFLIDSFFWGDCTACSWFGGLFSVDGTFISTQPEENNNDRRQIQNKYLKWKFIILSYFFINFRQEQPGFFVFRIYPQNLF